MKKSAFIILALAAVVLSISPSCKKLKHYTDFDLAYAQDFTIPASNGLINLPFDVVTPDMTTNTESKYDNNGTEAKLVDNVTLTRLYLVANSPSDANFNFLKSLEVYLSSPHQDEVLVAYIYDVPETGIKSIDLTTRDVNLKDYLVDDSYKIRVKTVMDHAVPYDVSVTSNEIFHVKAKLKNLFKK